MNPSTIQDPNTPKYNQTTGLLTDYGKSLNLPEVNANLNNGSLKGTMTTPAPTVSPTITAPTTPTTASPTSNLAALGLTDQQIAQVNSPQGMPQGDFTALLDQVQNKLKTNNTLMDQRALIMKHLFDSPLTTDELSKLPKDVQNVVGQGKDAAELQLRVINDQLQGRAQSLSGSIQALTTGYQNARTNTEAAMKEMTTYANASGQPLETVIKALSPIYGVELTDQALANLKELGIGTNTTETLTNLADALVGQESGGDYSAVNPDSGALGKYQIMPQYWFDSIGFDPNSEADKQKFLNDPALQDQAFQNVLSTYSSKYNGDPAKIAAAYYGGDAGAKAYGTLAGDVKQGNYPSVNQYVAQVLGRMPATTSSDPIKATAQNIMNGKSTLSMVSKFKGTQDKIRAAILAKDPNFDFAASENNYKTNLGAAKTLETRRATMQTFADSAEAGLQLLVQKSDAFDRTKYPFLNKPFIEFMAKIRGDVAAQDFLTAKEDVMNEVAKVISGSTTNAGITDAARAQANDMFGTAFTKEQLASAVEISRTLMKARMDALNSGVNDLLGTPTTIASANILAGEVSVTSPDGVVGTIPAEQLNEALSLGYIKNK